MGEPARGRDKLFYISRSVCRWRARSPRKLDPLIQQEGTMRVQRIPQDRFAVYACVMATALALLGVATQARADIVYFPVGISVSSPHISPGQFGSATGSLISADGATILTITAQASQLYVYPIDPSFGTDSTSSVGVAGSIEEAPTGGLAESPGAVVGPADTFTPGGEFASAEQGPVDIGANCYSAFSTPCGGGGLIGFSFSDDGATHYGWAGLNGFAAPLGASASIGSYAYESCPNTPILVGDTGTDPDDRGCDRDLPTAPEPSTILLLGTAAAGLVAFWSLRRHFDRGPC